MIYQQRWGVGEGVKHNPAWEFQRTEARMESVHHLTVGKDLRLLKKKERERWGSIQLKKRRRKNLLPLSHVSVTEVIIYHTAQ